MEKKLPQDTSTNLEVQWTKMLATFYLQKRAFFCFVFAHSVRWYLANFSLFSVRVAIFHNLIAMFFLTYSNMWDTTLSGSLKQKNSSRSPGIQNFFNYTAMHNIDATASSFFKSLNYICSIKSVFFPSLLQTTILPIREILSSLSSCCCLHFTKYLN